MDEAALDGVKAGDKLCIYSRWEVNRIEVVERVTPTGRVVTRLGQFDRTGYLRGRTSSWDLMRARPATEDDIAGIYRAGLMDKIERFRGWGKLSADDLKAVAALVDQYSKSAP